MFNYKLRKENNFQYTDLTVPKVKNFFKEILNKLMQIDISILNLLEQKGLLQNRSFSYKNAEDRDSKLFKVASTQQRPLNAFELASMFGSFQCNVGLALCTAFSDVAMDEDTKSFLEDGTKLSYIKLMFYQSYIEKTEYRQPPDWRLTFIR